MTYPIAMLIHQANLETGEIPGEIDAFGVEHTVKQYTQISCRFGQPKVVFPRTDAGEHVIRSPVCIVPAGTDVKEGKLLIGLTEPYAKTYRIVGVRPAMVARTVSHIVLDLEGVDG